jgi:hypothetical protein
LAQLSVLAAVVLYPQLSSAQSIHSSPAPLLAALQQPPLPAAQAAVEDVIERFGMGVEGGVGLDPQLIAIGAHGRFAPIFHRSVSFRPGVQMGFGEVTTELSINLDVMFTLTEDQSRTWRPYFGIGPTFGLSHRGFEEDIDDDDGDRDDDEIDNGQGDDDEIDDDGIAESSSRFDFGDTDFETGLNFIAGVRRASGLFLEMKATAYGVSNVKLLVGFDF